MHKRTSYGVSVTGSSANCSPRYKKREVGICHYPSVLSPPPSSSSCPVITAPPTPTPPSRLYVLSSLFALRLIPFFCFNLLGVCFSASIVLLPLSLLCPVVTSQGSLRHAACLFCSPLLFQEPTSHTRTHTALSLCLSLSVCSSFSPCSTCFHCFSGQGKPCAPVVVHRMSPTRSQASHAFHPLIRSFSSSCGLIP